MSSTVSWRVRVGLLLAGVPQVLTGLWAVLAPRSWFDRFPGVGADLVAAEPPYNRHLVGDVGAGFLAIGVALLLAAWWAERRPALLALVVAIVFAVSHLVYHVAHPAAALSSAGHAQAVGMLASAIVLELAVLALDRWEARHRVAPT